MNALLCSVCGKPGGLVLLDGAPCMPCIRSRHRTATNGGRCRCGRQRIAGKVRRVHSRSWVPCDRCLGTIEQLS